MSKWDEPIIAFWYADLQELSEKHFGDKLTEKEMEELEAMCNPSCWARVDDGGYEGALAHLIEAVIMIIAVVRNDRRGGHNDLY